jgi:thymidylate synthase
MEPLSKNYLEIHETASDAFKYFYDKICLEGFSHGNTKALFNVGFYIKSPWLNKIDCLYRNWSEKYAKREFDWYLSKNRSVETLKKYAPIWDKMHGGDNIVNSNYGFQWSRNNQLDWAIDELKQNPLSRRSVITILDSKEWIIHKYDTPCTCSIGFYIPENTKKLCMTVHMRSNDLWYGFCNDQYCFSELQKIVSEKLSIPIGSYYHFSTNFHLYTDQIKR